MNLPKNDNTELFARRNRLHELLIALIKQQRDLELMDEVTPTFERGDSGSQISEGKWLDKNQRVLRKYQSLVRSAIALDALLESEQCLT